MRGDLLGDKRRASDLEDVSTGTDRPARAPEPLDFDSFLSKRLIITKSYIFFSTGF